MGLTNGLNYGLSIGLTYWLLLGLYQSMKQQHLEDQNRSQFNQGIRRSLRNGLLISLVSAILLTIMGWLSVWLQRMYIGTLFGIGYPMSFQDIPGSVFSISFFLDRELGDRFIYVILFVTGMVIMWALSGGPTVLRHYVIRWYLAHHGLFPFRVSTFLDDTTARILLRRVGGGYQFIHRRLQDYFADTAMPPHTNE